MKYYYYCPERATKFYVTLPDMELTVPNRKKIMVKMIHSNKKHNRGYVFIKPNMIKKDRS